jgi:isoleucyl-tRNA synthetase
MSVSDEILKRMADSYRRMRNTQRFLLGNLHGFDPEKDMVAVDDMVAIDRWAVERCHSLQESITEAYRRFEFHQIYQRIHNFCVVDMGGFYLDVLKDRLYTTRSDGQPRRSAQSAMFHVAEAMVRWLAPILSFTAEEIWTALPGERAESVFLGRWYEIPGASGPGEHVDWTLLLQLRDAISRELERLRGEEKIRAGLDAEVDIYCSAAVRERLEPIAEELRFVFITSEARVHEFANAPDHGVRVEDFSAGDLILDIVPSENPKCDRCWHRRPDVGSDPEHREICGRCVQNVVHDGESRRFA